MAALTSCIHYQIFSLFSGVLSLLVVNPVFVAKTRLCLQYEESKDISKDVSKKIKYRGLSDALIKIFQQEGLRGFYKVSFIPFYNFI